MKSSKCLSGLAAGLFLLLSGLPAAAQTNVPTARNNWEKAAGELRKAHATYVKAQAEYDRATIAYVKVLQASAPVPPPVSVKPPAAPAIPTRTVNFEPPMGVGGAFIRVFRARLHVDDKATDWKSFAGTANAATVVMKVAPAKNLTYEVERRQGTGNEYRAVCRSNLAIKNVTTIKVYAEGCTVKLPSAAVAPGTGVRGGGWFLALKSVVVCPSFWDGGLNERCPSDLDRWAMEPDGATPAGQVGQSWTHRQG